MKKVTNIGEIIKNQVYKSGIPVTNFAKLMNKARTNVYNIFEREDMGTDIVWKASNLLDHNFFQDLADEFDASKSKENLDNESKAVAQFFNIVPAILREMGRDSQIIFDEDEEHTTPDLILPEYNFTFTKGEYFKERIGGENSLIKIVEMRSKLGSVIELVDVLDRAGFINIKLDYKTKEEWKEVLEFAFSILDEIMAEYNLKH